MTEAPLEHFTLIEDVIAHIRTKLPAESGPESWRLVCEDVLNCHLPAVEPLLLKELEQNQQNPDEQEKIRGLLRAASWYRHPPKTTDELLKTINQLRPTHPRNEDQQALDAIQAALEGQLEGGAMLPAANAIDHLFRDASRPDEQEKFREIRDQVYYQLLYPHWFEVVKQWAARQPTNSQK